MYNREVRIVRRQQKTDMEGICMAKEISRRNFLKGAAATALSAAVVGVTKPLAFDLR